MSEKKHIHGKRFKPVKLLWLLPGPVFYGLFRLAFMFPKFVETVYSRGIFRITNQSLSWLTGLVPVSVGELMLYIFIGFIVIFVVVMIVKSAIARRKWWIVLLKRVFVLAAVCSMLYMLFAGLWAFNYARQPLGVTLGLDTSLASVEELYATCEVLIDKAAVLRKETREDSKGVFMYSKQAAMVNTKDIYNAAANETGFDFLGGTFGEAKPVLYSIGLSKTHITGIYFPFSGEANVNVDVPDLFFASAALHETAHQRGFAREDEANFLAYYIASYSDEVSVEYSSVMLALVHAMNQLYDDDRDLHSALRGTYSVAMERDLANQRVYWDAYDTNAAQVSEQVNNSYLIANEQKDGVKSYGRMVDLLIGLWRSGEL